MSHDSSWRAGEQTLPQTTVKQQEGRMAMRNRQTDSRLPTEIIEPFLRTVPVDVYGMARALGVAVSKTPMASDVSGKIECEINGPCRITINSTHSETRQRFTLAHEIAHFVLQRDLIGDGIVDNGLYRSLQPLLIESQANRYAASLLMPVPLVRQAWENGAHDEYALASVFDVSPAVAKIRMKELGCVLWPLNGPVGFGRKAFA
ncbi:ImmA/IrrE family metallo-endopeptidase [Methylobacterium sp. CM6244]